MIKKAAFTVALLGTFAGPLPAMAWSWTNDTAGQKLDQDARHFLTTQNVCGVQLRPEWVAQLDAKIVSHFTTLADEYRRFLLSSVMSANADYLNGADPSEVKKECEDRVGEAAKAGVLAGPTAKPYQWAASVAGVGSTPSGSSREASIIGYWAAAGVSCSAVKNQSDERGLQITAKSVIWYESTCQIRSAKKAGNRITLQTICEGEGEKFRRTEQIDQLSPTEIRLGGQRYKRCE